jgi:beta-phosphoglucomutase-like phosphatase (HAD superfamily)
VQDGLQAEGIACDMVSVFKWLAGRSLAETVLAVSRDIEGKTGTSPDPVAIDLASLRAERTYAAFAVQGLPLVDGASSFVQDVASRARIIVRADSQRREVARTLAMISLDEHVAFMHCSDDVTLRSADTKDATQRSVGAAYRRIIDRLMARGIPVSACVAYEPGDLAREWARQSGLGVLESLSVA